MTKKPAAEPDFDGRWYNQHGSYMEIAVDESGNVTGDYVTKVGAPGETETFALVGFVASDQLSFTVNFGIYGSLTAWVGQLTEREGDAVIITFWHLTKNVADPDEPEDQWASILTGSDVFGRITPPYAALARTSRSNPRRTVA